MIDDETKNTSQIGDKTKNSCMFSICNFKGAGQYYHPRPLMKSNVVVVSINYRLGGLGFLNFGNRHVSGNQVDKTKNHEF